MYIPTSTIAYCATYILKHAYRAYENNKIAQENNRGLRTLEKMSNAELRHHGTRTPELVQHPDGTITDCTYRIVLENELFIVYLGPGARIITRP